MAEKAETRETDDRPPMHHREIKLEDGRYMIFYTFGDGDTEGVHDQSDPGKDV